MGSNPSGGSLIYKKQAGRFQSGQMDQTVTLLSYDFAGSNPALPTFYEKYFVSFKISFKFANRLPTNFVNQIAEVAQLVERQPSKLNVAGSTPVFRSN